MLGKVMKCGGAEPNTGKVKQIRKFIANFISSRHNYMHQ